jgi:hypothetical protein
MISTPTDRFSAERAIKKPSQIIFGRALKIAQAALLANSTPTHMRPSAEGGENHCHLWVFAEIHIFIMHGKLAKSTK